MFVKHKNHTKPSLEMIKACVSYDQVTGQFTWKTRPDGHFSSHRAAASWNTRFSGKPVMKTNRGYIILTITVDGAESYTMGHRAAWALMTGAMPEFEIDHINGIRGDNKWTNLRQATHQQNQWNKSASARNKSGFLGVHKHSQNKGKFVAQIRSCGITKHIGIFDSAEEAALAYQSASSAIHGEYMRASA
jgi:hypothetical protein